MTTFGFRDGPHIPNIGHLEAFGLYESIGVYGGVYFPYPPLHPYEYYSTAVIVSVIIYCNVVPMAFLPGRLPPLGPSARADGTGGRMEGNRISLFVFNFHVFC